MTKYLEDLAVGMKLVSPGDRLITRADIVAFATEWDPQLYHVDEDAAQRSPFGKFCASALHSMAVCQKLAHETGIFEYEPIIGLGIAGLAFPKPVLEGDRVRGQVTVQDVRPSKSRSDQGIVTILVELVNQDDDIVLSYTITELVKRRP
ncbi:MAG: hypothetical protein CMM59_23685 [Rhodospirillaceae bacterium]|nr:hypothetical protein [Rhodospirillaceae bacterium]